MAPVIRAPLHMRSRKTFVQNALNHGKAATHTTPPLEFASRHVFRSRVGEKAVKYCRTAAASLGGRGGPMHDEPLESRGSLMR